jgi:hypothetical protein
MAKLTQYSAVNLIQEAGVDPRIWSKVPADDVVVLKKVIPAGAEVMNGSSTTLIEIGYEDYISGNESGWNLVHKVITAENNDKKRAELRRKAVAADYFISGANAIARTGEIVACDATGSRVGAWPFAAGCLVLVAGVNKIVPTLADALDRVRKYAYPLENVRAKKAYGIPSTIGKCVILSQERNEGRVVLILIKESLGY